MNYPRLCPECGEDMVRGSDGKLCCEVCLYEEEVDEPEFPLTDYGDYEPRSDYYDYSDLDNDEEGPEEDEMPEERAHGGDAARDRRCREAVGAHLRDPPLELVRRRPGECSTAEGRTCREVAPVRVDRAG